MSSTDTEKNINEFNKFLSNNVEFLHEKFKEHYSENFLLRDLQTKTKIQASIRYIYDVFSFGKYQDDDKMNQTLKKSLRENILWFVKSSLKAARTSEQPEKEQSIIYDAKMGIQLLKYCIENNEMFAVHYDKKQTPEKQSQKQAENNQEPVNEQKGSEQSKVMENDSEVKNSSFVKPRSPFIIRTEEAEDEKPLICNEKAYREQQDLKAGQQALKKEAKVVFEFYCRQQLNTGGPSSTFDKIMHQSSTMTLGKFMAFANTAGILNQGRNKLRQSNKQQLNKKMVNEIFRKTANYSKQIDFETFFQVLKQINTIDPSVYEKLSIGRGESINAILRKLKYLNSPFNMKGSGAKEVQILNNPYIPKTTAHSGQFEASLKEHIESRKEQLRYLEENPQPSLMPFSRLSRGSRVKNQHSFVKESSFVKPYYGKPSSHTRVQSSRLLESSVANKNEHQLLSDVENRSLGENASKNSKIRLENSRLQFNQNDLSNEISVLEGLIGKNEEEDEDFLKEYKIPKISTSNGTLPLRGQSIVRQLPTEQHTQSTKYNPLEVKRQRHSLYEGAQGQRKNVVGQLKERIKQVELTQRNQMSSLERKRSTDAAFVPLLNSKKHAPRYR